MTNYKVEKSTYFSREQCLKTNCPGIMRKVFLFTVYSLISTLFPEQNMTKPNKHFHGYLSVNYGEHLSNTVLPILNPD